MSTDDAVEPFTISIEDAALDDLRERLARTRWADPEPAGDWSQGIREGYLRELCAYWADGYDWRTREAALNAHPQIRTPIDGVAIHAYHVRSKHEEARPLILTHGWPGSIVEFQGVIDALTDPTNHGGSAEDAFHVVCPSLPGYGFSDRPTSVGWNIDKTARVWAALMARLGYDRYFAQGGDWGSMVTTSLAAADPDHVMGIHLNMVIVPPDLSEEVTPTEQKVLDDLQRYTAKDSAYASINSTRPQTIGYGLVDSPVALAAYIVEKLWSWTDHEHTDDLSDGLESVLDRDQILDNVSIYWFTETGASAGRFYWEAAQAFSMPEVGVPVGISMFPGELMRTSKRWAEAWYKDVAYFNELDRGGHFAAWEQPDLFVAEVRAAFAAMSR